MAIMATLLTPPPHTMSGPARVCVASRPFALPLPYYYRRVEDGVALGVEQPRGDAERGGTRMMGTKGRDFAPLVNVSLEDLVPATHFYRHVERTLDLSFVRALVAPCYAAGGRPSIDPVVFFKLQVVLFFEGLHSERQLMRVVADRLSVRWYLGYDLGEALPDHSSLTKIRERYGVDTFRRFFDAIVEQCRAARLVWGKELYADATQVDANASLDSLMPRFAVEAHLQTLFGPGEASPGKGDTDTADDSIASVSENLPIATPDTTRQDRAPSNERRPDWIARTGEPMREETHGRYQRRADFVVSTSDPDATPMRRKGGWGTHLGYHTHTVVDGGKARIILQSLVTPSEVMENQPFLDLLWRVCFRWRLRPRHVTGDTTYGTSDIIKAVEDAGIRAYVPLPDWDARTPFFGQGAFTYDATRDLLTCPHGDELRRSEANSTARYVMYQAPASSCNACPLKPRCTTSKKGRRVCRSVDEDYLDRVRGYHETAAYQKAMNKRKVWVEPLYAEAKDWHGLRRFRLRGLWKVNCEALVTTTGQNLKRLLSKRGWGRRPWPSGAPSGMIARAMSPCTVPT